MTALWIAAVIFSSALGYYFGSTHRDQAYEKQIEELKKSVQFWADIADNRKKQALK